MTDLFSARVQIGRARWLSFREPALVLQADSPEAVHRTISDVEQLTRDGGLHAAGFVSYEAADAFGLSVRSEESSGLPLVWFASYPRSTVEESGPPNSRGRKSCRDR